MDELDKIIGKLYFMDWRLTPQQLEILRESLLLKQVKSAINSLTLKQVLSLINGAEEKHSEKWYQNSNPQEVGEAMGRDEVLEELRQSAERIYGGKK